MKKLKIFLICALLFLLERVFFARFQIFSLTPWLLYTFCLLSGAFSDEIKKPILISALCGLAADLTGGGAIGAGAVSFTLSAALMYFFVSKVFQRGLIVTLLAVFLVGIGGEMLCFSLNGIGANGYSAAWTLWHTALPLSVIDTVFALIIYPIAKRLFAGRREI